MDGHHKCSNCGRQFEKEQDLLKHNKDRTCHMKKESDTNSTKAQQKRNTAGMDHICEYCNKSFAKKSNLQRHLRTSVCQKVKRHHCSACPTSFGQSQQLMYHIRQEHGNQASQLLTELKCPKCGKTFEKKWCLNRHVKSKVCDKEVIKHQCAICQSSFSSKRDLEKHILKDHPTKAINLLPNLTCQTCFKTFPRKEHLELHLKKGYCEKVENRHPCPECGKLYKFRKRMLQHMRESHPEKAPTIKPHRLSDVRGYHCCGESFANGCKYRTHKDRVHIKKPEDTTTKRMTTFICKECELQFARKSELIQHKNEYHPPEDASSDDDELPKYFKCPYEGCQDCFQSRMELTNHKKLHREPPRNNILCDPCDEMFESTEEVQRHQMDDHDIHGHTEPLHHPVVGHGSYFDDRNEKLNHKETQHEVQCLQCGKWFATERELKIHCMDEHDPNDEPESQEAILNDLESLLDTASAKSLYTKVGIDIADKSGKPFHLNRTRQSFKLLPKALRLCEVGLTLELMNKVIGSLFKKTVEKGGRIQIKVLSDSLDTPIVMPLVKVELFDPLVLLNYIESVLSSKDKLALDQALTFDVTHVEGMEGSGYRLNAMAIESYKIRKRGIFDPRNLDNRCLGLCLAAWELIERLRNEGQDLRKAAFFKEPQKCHELKIMANRLYAETGVDPEKQCGDEELRRFQYLFNELHEKQIVVLDEKTITFLTVNRLENEFRTRCFCGGTANSTV